MFEVNLRTSPERLLDWDKPLSQQPAAVREALKPLGLSVDQKAIAAYDDALLAALHGDANVPLPKQPRDPSGDKIYQSVSSWAANNPGAFPGTQGYTGDLSSLSAEALRKQGIDGIQYLDQGSRAAGEGSRNYVMFRDDIIDVLKRYGLFGLGMVGASQAGPYGEANP